MRRYVGEILWVLTVAKGRKPEFFVKVVSKTGYVPEEATERVLLHRDLTSVG
jgi:hypothetical protein